MRAAGLPGEDPTIEAGTSPDGDGQPLPWKHTRHRHVGTVKLVSRLRVSVTDRCTHLTL
jgi:hypothetical protein